MKMTRRGFLQGIIAAGMAPAIVRATSIMPCIGVIVLDTAIIVPNQELVLQNGLIVGARVFTTALDTGAFMDAKAEGLVELRRFHQGRATMVDFMLPRDHGRRA